MTWSRANGNPVHLVALCLLITAVADVCSGLMLERLPRHIPRTKVRISHDSPEEDDLGETLDTSVEKKRIVQDPSKYRFGQIAPYNMKPTWKAIYPFAQDRHSVRSHKKRDIHADSETSENDQSELANILKDDDEGDKPDKKSEKKEKKEVPRHTKTKRQSNDEPQELKDGDAEEAEQPTQNQDFQDWLRREYYRNMAKSFASMRRKRSSGHSKSKVNKRAKKSVQSSVVQSSSSLSEITNNLRLIEDQLFQDALQTMRDGGEDYEEDIHRQNRISNDLSLAYDLETMRNAFFRLRETLANMESEAPSEEQEMYHTSRKRSRDCPSLDQLTSDCSSLSDIMPEGPLKRLLLRACNWHEVCYTCGKAYGLTSETCDGSFIEQTQTICRDDAPCESTASLLVVPLRQRRVFYKRSNPDVCIEEPCVESFLKEGLAAMEEGRYSMGENLNSIRHA